VALAGSELALEEIEPVGAILRKDQLYHIHTESWSVPTSMNY
jgi:hypothetical protein